MRDHIRHQGGPAALALLCVLAWISLVTLPLTADDLGRVDQFGKAEAIFVANAGQTTAAVRFVSAGSGVPVFFTDRDVRLLLE